MHSFDSRSVYLGKGVTKTGKPRYYFAREPKGEPVAQIPEGYEISESVNGIVSLPKKRPKLILPEEVAAVEAAIQQHSKPKDYRVGVKHKRIDVYKRVGPDLGDIFSDFKEAGLVDPSMEERFLSFQNKYDDRAQFTPVLRFILLPKSERRFFYVERMCYMGGVDDWITVFGVAGPIEQLASEMIPKLGTDDFFQLY